MLITSIIFISIAFVLYTIGIWAVVLNKRLKKQQLYYFWIGLCSDLFATVLMAKLNPELILSYHSLSGITALLIMLIHALLATVVVLQNKQNIIANFYKLSITVWIIWLLPYFTGIIMKCC